MVEHTTERQCLTVPVADHMMTWLYGIFCATFFSSVTCRGGAARKGTVLATQAVET